MFSTEVQISCRWLCKRVESNLSKDHLARCARMLAAAMMRHAASQLVRPTGPVKSLGSSTQDGAFVAPKFGTDIWVKVAGDSGAHAGPPDKVCLDARGCTDATCCTPTCSTYKCSKPGFVNTGQSGERNSDTQPSHHLKRILRKPGCAKDRPASFAQMREAATT